MHKSNSPRPSHCAGSTAGRSPVTTAKRCTLMLVSSLMLCLSLSACGGGDSGGSDSGSTASASKLGSDNKTREVRCAP